jgi:hypothetical protein
MISTAMMMSISGPTGPNSGVIIYFNEIPPCILIVPVGLALELLQKFKEKAPFFRAGMNPTDLYTDHLSTL